MSPALNPTKRLAAIRQPGATRSLLRIVDDNAKQRSLSGLPAASASAAPNVDFQEVSRLLQLAKKTLQDEHQRILQLKKRISELRGFEEAFFQNRETIDELRADRDMWRTQAVAMSNWLLVGERQH